MLSLAGDPYWVYVFWHWKPPFPKANWKFRNFLCLFSKILLKPIFQLFYLTSVAYTHTLHIHCHQPDHPYCQRLPKTRVQKSLSVPRSHAAAFIFLPWIWGSLYKGRKRREQRMCSFYCVFQIVLAKCPAHVNSLQTHSVLKRRHCHVHLIEYKTDAQRVGVTCLSHTSKIQVDLNPWSWAQGWSPKEQDPFLVWAHCSSENGTRRKIPYSRRGHFDQINLGVMNLHALQCKHSLGCHP